MTTRIDAVVIGAGIAGISVAAELARDRAVLVLEADGGPAQQTTGRSAAMYVANYGGPRIRPFTLASRSWLASGGGGHAPDSLLAPRGLVVMATDEGSGGFADFVSDGGRPIAVEEAVERFPAIRPERCLAAAFDPDVMEIDVAAAVAAARAALRERHGRIQSAAPVRRLERTDGVWHVTTPDGSVSAPLVVDAAGAWADDVAALAGLPRVGMTPLRRTICTFRAEPGLAHERWPMLLEADERFYVKPEPGQFLASPADETPSEPCDPRPEMIDVATAIERVQEATTLEARSILSSWAGLRTFAPDRSFVLGPDPLSEGFAWCAGHGGFGIQAAHGAARAVVSLIETGQLPDDIVAAGGERASVVVDRFRR